MAKKNGILIKINGNYLINLVAWFKNTPLASTAYRYSHKVNATVINIKSNIRPISIFDFVCSVEYVKMQIIKMKSITDPMYNKYLLTYLGKNWTTKKNTNAKMIDKMLHKT